MLAIVLLAWALLPLPAQAQSVGDLMVAPTRIIFDERDRTREVNLINQGNKEATYRISFENMTMGEDGAYKEITEPVAGEKFADPYLRFSPRQVTLKPGEVQKIRIMLRKTGDMAPGEYRSHMLFRALPPENVGEDVEAQKVEDGKVAVRLIPIFGVSIPVIFRSGDLASPNATLESASMDKGPDGQKLVLVKIARSGDESIYGDMNITFTPQGGAQQYDVGQLRGVSVLAPYPSRIFKVPVYGPEGTDIAKGTLKIVYRKPVEEGSATIAEKSLNLP
jgi:P pilus assembly chaperone PapD